MSHDSVTREVSIVALDLALADVENELASVQALCSAAATSSPPEVDLIGPGLVFRLFYWFRT